MKKFVQLKLEDMIQKQFKLFILIILEPRKKLLKPIMN